MHAGAPKQVIRVIDEEAVPLLKRCSLAGHAELKTHNPLFAEHPRAADMLIDILTDRGFSVGHTLDEHVVPVCGARQGLLRAFVGFLEGFLKGFSQKCAAACVLQACFACSSLAVACVHACNSRALGRSGWNLEGRFRLEGQQRLGKDGCRVAGLQVRFNLETGVVENRIERVSHFR